MNEEILKKAAEEAADAILSGIPDDSSINHSFSPAFERKMNKLIRHEKHSAFYRYMGKAACIAALIIAAGLLLLASSEEVRAAVFGWIKQHSGTTTVDYYFEGDADETAALQYAFGWIPEGYTLIAEDIDMEFGTGTRVYLDNTGHYAYLNYINVMDDAATMFWIDGDDPNYIYKQVEVSGYPADLYMSLSDEHTSGLVWYNEYNVLFYVSAAMDEEELIAWAESVYLIEE